MEKDTNFRRDAKMERLKSNSTIYYCLSINWVTLIALIYSIVMPELRVEIDETFRLLADGGMSFAADRLIVALKSLGLEADEKTLHRASLPAEITADEFICILAPLLDGPGWIQAEMHEAMSFFDQGRDCMEYTVHTVLCSTYDLFLA